MRIAAVLNENLVNVPGGAVLLQTPALVVNRSLLQSNLDLMQSLCDNHNHSLRPHTKTHKCVAIAKLQIERGAAGICCAKLSEAETMSRGGIENILVSSPVVTEEGIRRAISLSRTTKELLLTVDNKSVVTRMNRMAESAHTVLDVLVDLDPGMHRTGIQLGHQGIDLIQTLARDLPFLKFRGVQHYSGDLMHLHVQDERRNRYLARTTQLEGFLNELREMGIKCEIVSGGGTGSYRFDFESNVMTELQAGSYAFMDRQYLEIEPNCESSREFHPSLFVYTTIVSSNHSYMATTDAGLKAFATDDKTPLIVDGASADCQYGFMGDEHGSIRWTDHSHRLEVGTLLSTITPHCDPTINLYDQIHVLDGKELVDIWQVDARGCSQ